jgi:hypothetical protein
MTMINEITRFDRPADLILASIAIERISHGYVFICNH